MKSFFVPLKKGGLPIQDLKESYDLMFTEYPDLVDIKQLREMLGIGITLAYKLVKDNTIKSLKIGREYKIPKAYIISYLIKPN